MAEATGDGQTAEVRGTGRALVCLALAALAVVIVRTAWLCDDAYITFRVLDNIAHGYGPVWNVAERVQAYTHPLWLLLLAPIYALTGEIYYTSLLLSIGLSVAALAVLALGIARTPALALLGLAVAASSRALVDFSTSGLENPLTHLLLALALAVYYRGGPARLLPLAGLTGLLVLNRADIIWLVAPPLLASAWPLPSRRRLLTAAGLAAGPLALWSLFALAYYGFPWPNTAYAKLGTGIGRAALVEQGLLYLVNSLTADPLTLLTIGAAVAAGLAVAPRLHGPVVLGILLQLAYVVAIGGDFMSGRFLSAPLLAALAILVRLPLPSPAALTAAAAAIAVGLLTPYPTLLSTPDYGSGRAIDPDQNGITDERAYYYPASGLLRSRRSADVHPEHGWAREGRLAGQAGTPLVVRGNIGFFGYFAGPRVHILDPVGLSDPLLARLPAPPRPDWRPGHTDRAVPGGYPETLLSGRNELADPGLAAYYDQLALATRGPLLSRERLLAIWRLNTGLLKPPISDGGAVAPTPAPPPERVRETIEAARLATPRTAGTPWDAPGVTPMAAAGLEVRLAGRASPATVELSLDHNERYRVVFADGTEALAEEIVGPRLEPVGLAVYRVSVPPAVRGRGFTSVLISPLDGDGRYSLGHLRLLDGD